MKADSSPNKKVIITKTGKVIELSMKAHQLLHLAHLQHLLLLKISITSMHLLRISLKRTLNMLRIM